MSTSTLPSPAVTAEAEPSTEEVARFLYVDRDNRYPVFCQMVASDFSLPGLEDRIAKFIADAEPAERTRFIAEGADVRAMTQFLLAEARISPLIRPDCGKPIPNENFAAPGEHWVRFLVEIGVVPRPGTVRQYLRWIARRLEAELAAARPAPLSATIVEALSQHRQAQRRRLQSRLSELIADAAANGMSDYTLSEIVTVSDELGLSDNEIASRFAAVESRG